MRRTTLLILACIMFCTSTVVEAAGSSYWGKRISPTRYEAFQSKKENIKARIALREKRMDLSSDKTALTLVIAPHPDDEILCCSNMIHQKVQEGEPVIIVFITDGDARSASSPGISKEYGVTRQRESRKAAKALGLKPENLIFLNFPDGALDQLGEQTIVSPYTRQMQTSSMAYFPNIPYTRENLKQKLSTIISQLNPTTIYLPSSTEDNHPDHKVSGLLIKEVLESRVESMIPDVQEYFVHGKHIERDHAILDHQKLTLIRMFRSQMHDIAHQYFLENFAYAQETFNHWSQHWVSHGE